MTFDAAELSMYTNDSFIQNQPETDERITRDFWVEDQHNQAGIPNKKQIRNSMKTNQQKEKWDLKY